MLTNNDNLDVYYINQLNFKHETYISPITISYHYFLL